MTNANKRERAAFEKWGNAKGANVGQSWNGEFYENRLVQSAWQGWQEGYAAGALQMRERARKYEVLLMNLETLLGSASESSNVDTGNLRIIRKAYNLIRPLPLEAQTPAREEK